MSAPSPDAMGAARAYLRGIGVRESHYRTPQDKRVLAELVRETAEIMASGGASGGVTARSRPHSRTESEAVRILVQDTRVREASESEPMGATR